MKGELATGTYFLLPGPHDFPAAPMTLHPERVLAFGGEERRDDLRINDQRLCLQAML